MQSVATQVTLVTADVTVPTAKQPSTGTSAAGQQILPERDLKSGSATVLDTTAATGQTLGASSSRGSDPTNFTSSGVITSPSHISVQAAITNEENWSTTIVAPQQAVTEAETVATDTSTIVTATVAAAADATEDKTDADASASASADSRHWANERALRKRRRPRRLLSR